MSSDRIFDITITNGYVFRQIYELYNKLGIKNSSTFFKENGITIMAESSTGTRRLISDVELYTEDLLDYFMNTSLCKFNKPDKPAYHAEIFSVPVMNTNFKNIVKSHKVKIFRRSGNNYITIMNFGNGPPQNSTIETLVYSENSRMRNDISTFEESLPSKPNINIDIDSFCNMMKAITRGSTQYVMFNIYEDSLLVQGIGKEGNILSDGKWGKRFDSVQESAVEIEPEESDSESDVEVSSPGAIHSKHFKETEKHYKVRVSSTVVKNITKLNGMIKKSIIKVFSNRDGLMKLSHKIADFGEHNIYFSEEDEE